MCAVVTLAAALVMVRFLRWRDRAAFGLLLTAMLARHGRTSAPAGSRARCGAALQRPGC